MSIKLDYGTHDDHGAIIGPWLMLKIESPDGDEASELLDPDDARGLASNLREAARMVEDRAAASRGLYHVAHHVGECYPGCAHGWTEDLERDYRESERPDEERIRPKDWTEEHPHGG